MGKSQRTPEKNPLASKLVRLALIKGNGDLPVLAISRLDEPARGAKHATMYQPFLISYSHLSIEKEKRGEPSLEGEILRKAPEQANAYLLSHESLYNSHHGDITAVSYFRIDRNQAKRALTIQAKVRKKAGPRFTWVG